MSECGTFCVLGFELYHFSQDLTAEMGRQCRVKHAEIPSSSSVHLIMQLISGFPQVKYIIGVIKVLNIGPMKQLMRGSTYMYMFEL